MAVGNPSGTILAAQLSHVLKQQPDLKPLLMEALGVSERTLFRYASGSTIPSATDVITIAELAKMSLDRLLKGDENAISVSSEDEHVVWVPHLAVKASAGPGRVAVAPELLASRPVAFRDTWLRSLGVAPGNAHFLTADGDSMYPTIQDGDLMLADSGYGQVVNGKIYALVVNSLVIVKRLQVLAFGGLMLISDNDRYPAETIPREEVNDLRIEARIAWYGRPI